MRPTLELTIYPLLTRDERLIWSGHPRGGIRFHKNDLLMVPFSVVMFGIAVVWTVLAIATGSGGIIAFWGIPFLIIGLYMVFGRFLLDAYARDKTIYALTDRRALIVTIAPRHRVHTLPLATLPDFTLTGVTRSRGESGGADEYGTIHFEAPAGPSLWTGFVRMPGGAGVIEKLDSPMFADIPNPHAVFQLLERAREAAAQQPRREPPDADFGFGFGSASAGAAGGPPLRS